MASDSRTNAGFDDLNIARKMHTFSQPGERAFVVLSSGSLSLSQSSSTWRAPDSAPTKAWRESAACTTRPRELGDWCAQVADLDRAALERDNYSFKRAPVVGRPGARRRARALHGLSPGQSHLCD